MKIEEAIALLETDFWRNQKKTSIWLDLGSGSGLFSTALSDLLPPGSRIVATDKQPQSPIRSLNKEVTISFQQMNFETELVSVTEVDGIMMANSLHYVEDKLSFLNRCIKGYGARVFLIIEYDTEIPVPGWVPYPISFASLRNLFTSVGFQKIEKLHERPSVFHHGNMYAALAR